ncbi:MAG: NAD-dependent protein deacylase [Oligoflexia bacterium]|nr:MAG: NAD-dependent protein deacylase [Oligoflexia bacterium]
MRTFRDQDGLWEGHRIEDVATPEAFYRNPKLVHEFYNQRRRQLREVKPNAAHLALVELEQKWPGDFLLVTQNVDDLHERAGSKKLIHMHGELKSIFCLSCDSKFRWEDDLSTDHLCPQCQKQNALRPDIVWFGEMPYEMDQITEALTSLKSTDYFVAIGTSGVVYPAAGFVQWARQAKKIEVNLKESAVSDLFNQQFIGPASVQVPELVKQLLRL